MILYRDVLPRLKYGDIEFAQMVEGILLQTLGKCPSHVIHDAVSCLCAIVGNISHRYSILIKMLRSCLGKFTLCYEKYICIYAFRTHLLFFLNSIASLENDKQIAIQKKIVPKPIKTVKALMICGFLCQYFDFDEMRTTKTEAMTELDSIDKVSNKWKSIETRTRHWSDLFFFLNREKSQALFLNCYSTLPKTSSTTRMEIDKSKWRLWRL